MHCVHVTQGATFEFGCIAKCAVRMDFGPRPMLDYFMTPLHFVSSIDKWLNLDHNSYLKRRFLDQFQYCPKIEIIL